MIGCAGAHRRREDRSQTLSGHPSAPALDRCRARHSAEIVVVIGGDERRGWQRLPLALLECVERRHRDQCAGDDRGQHGRLEEQQQWHQKQGEEAEAHPALGIT